MLIRRVSVVYYGIVEVEVPDGSGDENWEEDANLLAESLALAHVGAQLHQQTDPVMTASIKAAYEAECSEAASEDVEFHWLNSRVKSLDGMWCTGH